MFTVFASFAVYAMGWDDAEITEEEEIIIEYLRKAAKSYDYHQKALTYTY